MKNFYQTMIAIASILVASACSQKVDPAADNAALDHVTKTTIQAFNEGNIEDYVALIADDAVYMPPNTGALVGKEVIRDWYEGVQSRNQFEIDIIKKHISLRRF